MISTTPSCVSVDLLEGRKTLQWDLDRLDQWDKASCRWFSKRKCWVLHFGHHKSMQSCKPDTEWLENCLMEEDLEGAG